MTLRDGMWSGQPCLIVGGGPSLRGYDWAWTQPHAPRKFCGYTIAVNKSAQASPVAHDVWIGIDAVYWRKLNMWEHEGHVGVRVWVDTGDKRPGVDVVVPCAAPAGTPNRHSALVWGRSLSDGIVAHNSGLAALNLADVLGADPIYLLGFDLRGENGKTANWHSGYTHDKRANESVYDRMLEAFRWAAEQVRARVVVLEVNAGDSRLDCFPKSLASDVL